jgi:hypothetical protein
MKITINNKDYYGQIDWVEKTFKIDNDVTVDVLDIEDFNFFKELRKLDSNGYTKKLHNIQYEHNTEKLLIQGLYVIQITEDLVLLKYNSIEKIIK